MDWLQILAVLVGNAAVVIPLWLHLETKMDQQAARVEDQGRRIEDMMRDFHGRLCAIEERYQVKRHQSHH